MNAALLGRIVRADADFPALEDEQRSSISVVGPDPIIRTRSPRSWNGYTAGRAFSRRGGSGTGA